MKWHEYTAPEIAALLDADPVVVLPVAAVEQHGPHLPLSTDLDIGRGILDEALRAVGPGVRLLEMPTQAVGTSGEHASITGTLSIGPEVLEEVIFGIAASLAGAGVRRLVISNSHGGNRATIDTAALRIREQLEMLVVKANYFRFPRPDRIVLPETEWTHGLHGGALETAMMLHLRPELVREERIRAFPSLGEELERDLIRVRPEGAAPFAWLAHDLNPDGVTGNASLATSDMGARLVEHYGGILAEVLRDAAAFPIERLRSHED